MTDASETVRKRGSEEPYNDMRIMEKIFDFIHFFGKLFGSKCCYEWKSNFRFWFAFGYLAFTWSQFFYSQFTHAVNGDFKRIFEVFALYGIAISVIALKLLSLLTRLKDFVINVIH